MLHRSRSAALPTAVVGVMIGLSTGAPAAERKHVKAEPRLGINLAGPADWNTELPFVDVFRMSRPWISQRKGAKWGQGPKLALDRHGWVTKLEPDCWAETPLCTIQGGHYPGGKYTVLYEGRGKIAFWNAATVVSQKPGRMVIEVDPAKGGFFLRITRTDPDDYIRNIRVVMPGFVDTYRKDPFHPAFLKRWQGVAAVRFMDWMHTNRSRISHWSQRPTPQDATFSQKGVALELMIDLCNRWKADPWFCMPHLADDDYVRKFARMVKRRLDPKLKVYIEYSNEVWNSIFPQNGYAVQQGRKLKFAGKPWEAAWKYTAYRSVQIFGIWEEVFGGTSRLVRVLPTQAANPYVSRQIVGFQDAYQHADALGIAPYMGFLVRREGKGLTTRQVAAWTVDQVLDRLEQQSLARSVKSIRQQKKVADQFGLKLVAYEGGQHMVVVPFGAGNEPTTRLFMAANGHERMGKIYLKYLESWAREGGDLFCHFSSVGKWSKWGSWGALQYYDDNPAKSPKFMAIMRWARQCGQPVNLPR